jgi:hypothetical protein
MTVGQVTLGKQAAQPEEAMQSSRHGMTIVGLRLNPVRHNTLRRLTDMRRIFRIAGVALINKSSELPG